MYTGFPIDMPVMLTYFENNELMPVRPDYPDYDHLINHVSTQMDFNECQLYKTPVVLTLQGAFIHSFIHTYIHTYLYAYTHTHTHTHTLTHTHTHTLTHTLTL